MRESELLGDLLGQEMIEGLCVESDRREVAGMVPRRPGRAGHIANPLGDAREAEARDNAGARLRRHPGGPVNWNCAALGEGVSPGSARQDGCVPIEQRWLFLPL